MIACAMPTPRMPSAFAPIDRPITNATTQTTFFCRIHGDLPPAKSTSSTRPSITRTTASRAKKRSAFAPPTHSGP
jgi:hypothetical protein